MVSKSFLGWVVEEFWMMRYGRLSCVGRNVVDWVYGIRVNVRCSWCVLSFWGDRGSVAVELRHVYFSMKWW